MFSGMDSYPQPDEVIEGLGDKVIAGLSGAVGKAANDLKAYREFRPDWVADHSERGLANWIHDRLWRHLLAELDELPGVKLVDEEPIREIFVGVRYRLRVKRHREDGAVSTYLTPLALEFFAQGQLALEGLEEIKLIAGYEWDPDTRMIGGAVISMRDGRDNLMWIERLQPPATGAVGLTPTPVPGPTPPKIDVATEGDDVTAEGPDQA